MTEVFRRPAARRDLVEHYAYLYDNASEAVADRFLSQVEGTFTLLLKQPDIGAPLTLKHSDLANLRKWRVKDFDDHLVFYAPQPDGLFIVRVLHAASDWWGLLGVAD